MDELVFESIQRYFKTLSNLGYKRQKDVNSLLVLIFIQELLDNDFQGYITEEDYNIINKALYCIFGKTCLIPYPDYYNTKSKRIMYLGSLSELLHRQESLETTVNTMEFAGDGSGVSQDILDSISNLQTIVTNMGRQQDSIAAQQQFNTSEISNLQKKVVIVSNDEEIEIADIDLSDLNN